MNISSLTVIRAYFVDTNRTQSVNNQVKMLNYAPSVWFHLAYVAEHDEYETSCQLLT